MYQFIQGENSFAFDPGVVFRLNDTNIGVLLVGKIIDDYSVHSCNKMSLLYIHTNGIWMEFNEIVAWENWKSVWVLNDRCGQQGNPFSWNGVSYTEPLYCLFTSPSRKPSICSACLLSGLVGIEEQQCEHISVNVLVISVAAVLLKAELWV